jgi:hypothetical protein
MAHVVYQILVCGSILVVLPILDYEIQGVHVVLLIKASEALQILVYLMAQAVFQKLVYIKVHFVHQIAYEAH